MASTLSKFSLSIFWPSTAATASIGRLELSISLSADYSVNTEHSVDENSISFFKWHILRFNFNAVRSTCRNSHVCTLLVFRHFPLSTPCNMDARRKFMCQGAQAMSLAPGGGSIFWHALSRVMHDLLHMTRAENDRSWFSICHAWCKVEKGLQNLKRVCSPQMFVRNVLMLSASSSRDSNLVPIRCKSSNCPTAL